ncbi:stage II sporulation protein P [Thermanaeromonas toyohensis]|uniref:stage II sporulation protein P n=1 Tax=Thermanaeromonas toyohensis TaxID=161154 RepID=UPI0015600E09|nr:stage II sporulation protein P [Thermanaeromonas toyohensis]
MKRNLFRILVVFLLVILGARSLNLLKIPQTLATFSFSLPSSFWERVLYAGLPTLVLRASQPPRPEEGNLWPFYLQALAPGLVKMLTAEEEEYPSPGILESPPPPPPIDITQLEEGRKHPLVAIYNTHNAESYAPSQGAEKLPGQNGGVVQVAAVLAETLTQDYGIPVVRSETIHDYPDFTLSYANSEKTVRRMLAENPSIQIVLDIHRDAGLKQPPVAYINNQEVAQILIIVGSNARLEHPNWRQNEVFAQKLAAKMDKLYPGLSRGIRVQQGRYNQHLHPRALLLEIGSSNNTLDQAERSAKLLARVIAEVLQDLKHENPLKQPES